MTEAKPSILLTVCPLHLCRAHKQLTGPSEETLGSVGTSLLLTSSTGDSLPAGAVVGAAAERDSNHAAGEGHEQGVMVPVQLQAQNPPVLSTNVAPEGEGKRPRSEVSSGKRGEFT